MRRNPAGRESGKLSSATPATTTGSAGSTRRVRTRLNVDEQLDEERDIVYTLQLVTHDYRAIQAIESTLGIRAHFLTPSGDRDGSG